jgi:hypothetical protein
MLEYLIMLPNLLAGYFQMKHKVHYSNIIYIPGYLFFMGYNYFVIHSVMMVVYFTILWVMAVRGVFLHLWNEKARVGN